MPGRGSPRTRAASTVGLLLRSLQPGSPGLRERLDAVPRLVAATLQGDYPGLSRRRLALLLGGAAYVLSPVDLVPEALLPLLGLGDDALVTGWLAAALLRETDDFLHWERTQGVTVRSHVL